MRYNMCVTTGSPADGVYLMCVLILAGAVCQTVSQSHQTLSKPLVDGVTPSHCSNRARGQHWKTHTHTHRESWTESWTHCVTLSERSISVSMHYLTINVVLCLLMAAAVGPDWDETSSQLTTLLSKQVFVSMMDREVRYYQSYTQSINTFRKESIQEQEGRMSGSSGSILSFVSMDCQETRRTSKTTRQSFYSQFLVRIKIKVGYMHFKGRCQEVMKVRVFFSSSCCWQ